MKQIKQYFAAALVLLLLAVMMPAAYADVIYPAPAPIQAGTALDHLLATVTPGTPVSVEDGTLPAGVGLYTEDAAEGVNLYLRGTPMLAGSYSCMFSVGGANMSCPLTVEAASPILLGLSSDVSCSLNEPVQLDISAYAPDGGTLSYQWYFGQPGSGAVIGDNFASLSVGTSTPGTSYYYCVVTNTNNGMVKQTTSSPVSVTVGNSATLSSVTLYAMPYKTVYNIGETLDPNGLQLSLLFSDGSSQVIGSGFTVDNVPFGYSGNQTVNVYYEGFTCSFNVTVQEQAEVITGIGVLTLPNKIRYTIGETLDTAGLSIRAYNNSVVGYRDIGREFLTCSPTSLNIAGTQEILVVFGDKTCTFTVTVEEAEYPASLVVDSMPTRTTYVRGQSLDITGLVLKQISSRQNTQLIYSGFTCTPTQLNTVGRQQVTVYYGNLSTTFTVTVTEPSAASPTPSTVPTSVPTSVPTAVPTGMPTAVPSAAPSAVPSATPSPLPTVDPALTARGSGRNAHQSNLGRTLVGVILVTALVALAVLGTYVFVMNQGGLEGAEQRLRELFGKNNNQRGRK